MRLETERLILREFTPEDEAPWLAIHADPTYRRSYPEDDLHEAKLRGLLESFVAWQSEQPRFRWQLAIALPESDTLIGTCGIRLEEPGSSAAELGYGLAAAYWGQGYATEAARRMLRFAFDEQRVHRVGVRIAERNARSLALATRLGFVAEGRLREHARFGAEWRDDLLLGLLVSEWRTAQS